MPRRGAAVTAVPAQRWSSARRVATTSSSGSRRTLSANPTADGPSAASAGRPAVEEAGLFRGEVLLDVDLPLFRSTETLGPGPGELSVLQAALRLLVDAGDPRAWPLLEAEAARDGARGRWARALRERRTPPAPGPRPATSPLDALARRLLGRPLAEVYQAGLPAARARLEAERRAEADALATLPRDPAPDGDAPPGLPRRRPSRRLPRRTVHLAPPTTVCATCQGPLAPLRAWTAEHVDWVGGAPAVVEYVRARLRCPACRGRVVMASLPSGPRGLEPAFVAELLVARLVERTPLAALAARPGWPDAPGLARGLLGAAALLGPVAARIRTELLAGGAVAVARADVLVDGRPTPLWVHRGPPGALLVVVELHPPDDGPAAVLRGFAGSVQSDAPLDEGLFADRTRRRAGSLRALRDGLSGLDPREELVLLTAFERLAEVEARLREASPEARHAARQVELRPLVDELLAWLDDQRGDDVAWRYRERDALLRLLEDGRLDADAGAARRALDRIVAGRAASGAAAWTFATTPGLARAAATLHTVAGSALDRGLDPRRYLAEALVRAREGAPPLTPRER